jgi:uncharacterized membrane protein
MYSSYEGPTVLGIPEKWERVLCYALLWISGIVLLIIEQRNQNVRRHAAQSVIVFGALSILGAISGLFGGWLGGIFFIGLFFHFVFGLLGLAVQIATVGLWLLLMLMAYSRPTYVLPFGRTYERLVG